MITAHTLAIMPTEIALLARPDVISILRTTLGLDTNNGAYKNQFKAPLQGPTLQLCHAMADAGLLCFTPRPGRETGFIATSLGAEALGVKLDDADSVWIEILNMELASDDPMEVWRQSMRAVQQAGITPLAINIITTCEATRH